MIPLLAAPAPRRRPATDADGRVLRLLPGRPLRPPPGRCLSDISAHLTPRRRLEWVAQLEVEAALPTPERPPLVARVGESSPGELAALDWLDEVGACWEDVRMWAVASRRWDDRSVARDVVEVVSQYVAHRVRWDAALADPAFWREVVRQCEAVGESADPEWAAALALVADGAAALLDVVARRV